MFGTILFPFHVGIINHVAMDSFFSWDVHSKSSMLTILVNTLLLVDICNRKLGKITRCCCPLLFVWAYIHFYANDHRGVLSDPLRSFSEIPSPRKHAMKWKSELERCLTIVWTCPWFHSGRVLIRCGDFPSVPLMGLRGCITYSSKLALMQLMRTQTLPTSEELEGLCFLYSPEQHNMTSIIKRVWDKPVYLGDDELGKLRIVSSNDYDWWRNEQGVSSIVGLTLTIESN
uniref:DUF7745 domain-containing protein n=1 Tax=Cajanus cajan TaxID=3821 RepID=A0A151R2E2_CAJCA|nr:hypothetical protein KK1_042156 [Cajanus cajan]